MILNGTEQRTDIWTDEPYTLANATWYGHRKLVHNGVYWFACFDRYGDDDWQYQTVVMKSEDCITWEDTGFPFTPGAGVSFAYPNMAVDSTGRVHLAANDNSNNRIRYCIYENGAWGTVEALPQLPGNGYVDADILLLIDTGDKPHVVFATGGTNGKVYYSNRVSGAWSAYEAVQPAAPRHYLDSAAIGYNDDIHITMVSMSDFNIYYAKGKAGSWPAWEMVFNGSDCNGSDIAVDSTGKPYIILARGTEMTLLSRSGSWTSDRISSVQNSTHPNLHISGSGKIYIAWVQAPAPGYNNQQIYMTHNEGGTWSEPVNASHDDTLQGWAYPVIYANDALCGVMAMNYDYTHICGWFAAGGGGDTEKPDKWGELILNITQYSRDEIPQLSAEHSLIPLIGVTAAQSRLLSAGRLRERRSVCGWAVKADFDSLEADYEAFAKNKVQFHDGTKIDPTIIEELSGTRQKGTDIVFYEITFLEV